LFVQVTLKIFPFEQRALNWIPPSRWSFPILSIILRIRNVSHLEGFFFCPKSQPLHAFHSDSGVYFPSGPAFCFNICAISYILESFFSQSRAQSLGGTIEDSSISINSYSYTIEGWSARAQTNDFMTKQSPAVVG